MLGERLQELRKDKGISQAELAQLLGVSHYTVSSYECNRSDPDDKIKVVLAKYFNVSLDYLLGIIDEPAPYNRDENSITLPSEFTTSEKQDIERYIRFLQYCKNN